MTPERERYEALLARRRRLAAPFGLLWVAVALVLMAIGIWTNDGRFQALAGLACAPAVLSAGFCVNWADW